MTRHELIGVLMTAALATGWLLIVLLASLPVLGN